jgi:hypothetical protein
MTIRCELERFVVSTNSVLKEVVQLMDDIILLRNCHPMYRYDFALRLYRSEVITKEQCQEFTDPRGITIRNQ